MHLNQKQGFICIGTFFYTTCYVLWGMFAAHGAANTQAELVALRGGAPFSGWPTKPSLMSTTFTVKRKLS